MKKLFTILALTACFAATALEQFPSLSIDLIPPRPQSAAIIEQQLPTPSLLTGAADFSLPLYTIDVNGFSLPLELRYRSNGVKVFDDPGPLGYGWSLLPALRVTRTVLGRPDEQSTDMTGDLLDRTNTLRWKTAYYTVRNVKSTANRYDCMPDIFKIALPDKILTRILRTRKDGSHYFVGVGDDEYVVTCEKVEGNISTISVRDDKGTEYIFGDTYEFVYGDKSKYEYRTAWMLREIRPPYGRSIRFAWSLHQGRSYAYEGGAVLVDSCDTNYAAAIENNARNMFSNWNTVYGLTSGDARLDSITFDGGKVAFSYSIDRLAKITVRQTDNATVNVAPQVRTVKLSYCDAGYKGYVLTNAEFSDIGSYHFGYDIKEFVLDPAKFPSIYAQDWWGYYNGKKNSTLTPALKIKKHANIINQNTFAGWHNVAVNCDRSVNAACMEANMLKRVQYPGGGKLEYVYEPHTFPPCRVDDFGEIQNGNPTLSSGGGLRVKTILMYDYNESVPAKRVDYDYDGVHVRSVPSGATFIEKHPGITSMDIEGGVRFARVINILPESNYMRYDIGELPIWYGKVDEIYSEGKKSYTFGLTLIDRNFIKVRYGKRVPVSLSSIFSQGPQLKAAQTFDANGDVLSEDRYEFERVSNGTLQYAYITRELISINPKDADAPDFTMSTDGKYLQTNVYGTWGDRNILTEFPSEHSYPFGIYPLSVVLQAERQTRHTHTEYGSGIANTVTKTTNYKGGTGLPLSVTTTGGGLPTETVTLAYPTSDGSSIELEMASGNFVGLPMSETRQQAACISVAKAEYARCRSGFKPVRITRWDIGKTDTLQSPHCTYADNGKIADYTDADGCTATYLYGYNNRYPVAKIDGMHLSQVAGLVPSAISGNAESHNLSAITDVPVTRMYYKPLIGLTALRQPWGSKQTFTYNDDGMLETSGIEGLGTMVRYDYERPTFRPFSTTETRYRNADGSRTNRTVNQYDGLNRIVSSRHTYYGTKRLYRYDGMGRVSGEMTYDVVEDDALWTDYGYEASPRTLRVSETKPGSEWKAANKSVVTQRRPNGTDAPFTCHELKVDGDGNISCAGLFAPGSVMMEAVTDEDGHCVLVAKDRDGNIRLRREGSGTAWLSTYYIYDNFGRLRYILPPALPPKSYDRDDAGLADFAFIYEYDGAGRPVRSKKPGEEASTYIYTPGGRLLAERIPAMPVETYRVHLYDRLGREAITGLMTDDGTKIASIRDKACTLGQPSGSRHLWYDISHIDVGYGFTPECVRVYDSYTVMSHDFSPDSIAGVAWLAEPMGLLTGMLNFHDDGDFHTETYFYDAFGRMIQSQSSPGATEIVRSLSYTYNGEVATELIRLSDAPTEQEHTLRQRYSYDNAGNIVGHKVWLDGNTSLPAEMSMAYDGYGRVAKQVSGRATRTLEYDDRGWLSKVSTFIKAPFTGSEILNPLLPDPRNPLAQSYYAASAKATVPPGFKPPYFPNTPVNDYSCTEEVFYATGAHPRYSGTSSAYTNTRGGRYDYRYDSFDRLVGADYSSEREGEDFSTEYAYDEIGRPTWVKRWGVVDLDGKDEVFGVADATTIEYEGALPSFYSGDTDAVEGSSFYGRTGIGTQCGSLEFDGAGRLQSEKIGKTTIGHRYNALGRAVMIGSSLRSSLRRGSTVTQTHDCRGMMLSRRVTQTRVSVTDTLVDRRYVGPFTFSGDTLVRVDFAGGFFDSHGYPNYMLPDRLGSVDMVVNFYGFIEQHNGYYPYGELWREPKGNHLLFAGKERMRHIVRDSDFGPRALNTAMCLWNATDRRSETYPWLSPFTYCGANPVKFIDPTGDVIKGAKQSDTDAFKGYLDILFGDSYTQLTSLISTKGKKIVISDKNLWNDRISQTDQSDPGAKLLSLIGTAIFDKHSHFVEYVKDNEISGDAQYYVKKMNTLDWLNLEEGMTEDILKAVWKGGLTFPRNNSTHSLILPTLDIKTNIWVSIHEVIGHGLPLSRKIVGAENNSHAIQVENLVRLMLGLPLTDGKTHSTDIINPTLFPSLY